MTRVTLLALAFLWGLSLVSCRPHWVIVEHDVASAAGPHEEKVVGDEPPAPNTEVVPAPPSPNHVWVEGYWTHCYNGWVWMPGCYALRPRLHAVWVSGYWERHPRGWVWIYGRWS